MDDSRSARRRDVLPRVSVPLTPVNAATAVQTGYGLSASVYVMSYEARIVSEMFRFTTPPGDAVGDPDGDGAGQALRIAAHLGLGTGEVRVLDAGVGLVADLQIFPARRIWGRPDHWA